MDGVSPISDTPSQPAAEALPPQDNSTKSQAAEPTPPMRTVAATEELPVVPSMPQQPVASALPISTPPSAAPLPIDYAAVPENLLLRLGKLRDGALTLGLIVLALGFISVQLEAFRERLGSLPATTTQYFVAGIVPFILLLAFASTIHVTKSVVDAIGDWIRSNSRFRWLRRITVFILYVVQFVALLWLFMKFPADIDRLISTFPSAWQIIPLIVLVGVQVQLLLITLCAMLISFRSGLQSRGRLGNLSSSAGSLSAYLMIGIIPLMAFGAAYVWFETQGYPGLVQEFGGVQFGYAYLDIVRSRLSKDTQAELLPQATPRIRDLSKDTHPVVRTVELLIEYDAGDFMLVRRADVQNEGDHLPRTYRIPRDSIAGVSWIQLR